MDKELLETLKASLKKNGVPDDVVEFSFSEVLGETEKELPETEQAPDQDEVPPLEEQVDESEGKLVEQEQPELVDEVEVPANEPVLPPELMEKIAQIDSLARDNEELKKANEGLQAKVDALLDSLRQAGVIEGSVVNTINPPTPEITGNNPTTDVMGSILDVINGKKHY